MAPNSVAFGWKPDLPDIRDHYYVAQLKGELPLSVDMRKDCPPVYDQGKLGSCTANAIAAALDFERHKQAEAFITPSRLFIYYNERLDDNTVESDSGASIRESVKTVHKKGACTEQEWPYHIDMFAVEPPPFAYEQAVQYEALKYLRIPQTELAMKSCLAEGYPFVCGITVYDSFMSKNPIKTLPDILDNIAGGHAVMIVGFTTDGYWIMRNSWGVKWGEFGYCYLPKDYLLNPDLSDDRWSLRLVK